MKESEKEWKKVGKNEGEKEDKKKERMNLSFIVRSSSIMRVLIL